MISCAVTAQLTCAIVFAYGKKAGSSHDAAQFLSDGVTAVFYFTCWPPSFPRSTPYTTSYDSTTMTTLSDSGESGQDNIGEALNRNIGLCCSVPHVGRH